jgi:hypothetical protein
VNTTIEKAAALPERDMIALVKGGTMKRSEAYELLDHLAQARRRDGESRASAFTRFVTKDELGRDLLAVQKSMPGSDIDPNVVAKSQARRDVDIRKDGDGDADPLDHWNALIDGIRRGNPRITRSAAHDEALKTDGGRKLWAQVKARDLRKQFALQGVPMTDEQINKIFAA